MRSPFFLSVSLFVLFGLLSQTPVQAQEGLDLEVVQLSDRAVIVRHGGPQPTNLIALNSREGIVVIDAGISAVVAEAARKRIGEVFGRDDFAYLVNTHAHGDHTYGNQAFADLTIVGHGDVPSQMEANEAQRGQSLRQITGALESLRARLEDLDPTSDQAEPLRATISYYEILASDLGEAFRLTPPTTTFSDQTTLDLGDLTLEMVYFGKAHSDTDILIFCPEEGLLATGDLFYPGNDLYLDSERVPSIGRWARSLDWALDEGRGVTAVVPGHGDLLPLDELHRIRGSVRAQQASVEGKSSAFQEFQRTFEEEGTEAALLRMDELISRPQDYYFFHAEFDSFVYRLMLDEELGQAIPLFEKLAVLFPDVPNAFDSLGEAYLRADRKEDAATAFQKCLDLDPDHQNAKRRLGEIGKGP